MAVPKKRHTKSRRNRRRSHQALDKTNLIPCPKCKEMILPHRYCPFCGTYNGKEVVDVMAKLTKKEKKKKQKEMEKKQEQEAEKKSKQPLDLKQLSKK